MPQEKEDVFGTRYNNYTQKFHSKQEMFAAGVSESDSQFEAASKMLAKKRNDDSLERQQEANQMLFEKYGSSGLNLSKEREGEKGTLYYLLQFVGLLIPGLNFVVYPCLLYFVFSKVGKVKAENRTKFYWYAFAMVAPFAIIVLPSLSLNKNELIVPLSFFLMINVVIALSAMLFNYLCEQLQESN